MFLIYFKWVNTQQGVNQVHQNYPVIHFKKVSHAKFLVFQELQTLHIKQQLKDVKVVLKSLALTWYSYAN